MDGRERPVRVATLLALVESPGLEGDALAESANELLAMGENEMRRYVRENLPAYRVH